MPCNEAVLSALSQVTKDIKLGFGVTLTPHEFIHPARVAEKVATVDLLSQGRVQWGIGRSTPMEQNAFHVDRSRSKEKMRAAARTIAGMWEQEFYEEHSEFLDFPRRMVTPKPYQYPHPPVWMAATSEAAIEWAAGRGFSILMDPHAAHRDIGRKRRFYAERLKAAGFSPAGRELPVARLLALGRSTADAKEVARRGAQWICDSYFGAQHRPVGVADPNEPGRDPVQRYLDEVILYGTPQAVLDEILRLREEIGLDYLLAAPLSHDTFVMLTERILPRLP
jgi:alkanesulfonate monooxygenase SsuD/methylene tetrahydromethanopterin reductase-like flavin-dependent oxidoreductase (luciferase family)